MPTAQNSVVVANSELAKLTGKTFVVEGVGTKNAVIVPMTGVDGKAIIHGKKIILAKNTTIEGLSKAGAGKAAAVNAAQTPGMAILGNPGVAAKTGAILPRAVEIEGAGKLVGSGQKIALSGLEIRGTLQPGSNGSEVLFTGGEAKLTIKSAAAKANGAGATAMAKGAGLAGKGAGTLANQAPSLATGAASGTAAASTAAKAATAGTIWKGTGLSLGLGLGLGAWGPVLAAGLLAAAGVGVYSYMKRKA
ncbi:MAG: hypothetical protein HQL73_10080 [Magnetococcales bacterium]|nr:hypothetical protein [Magnetococcales bacterium]